MTLAINIKGKPYAVGLQWHAVENEKKAQDKLRQSRGDSFVLRKTPDKSLQAGIVHGSNLGKFDVAADNIAIKFAKNSGIFVCKADYVDVNKKLSSVNSLNQDDYWAVAVIAGNIASGSDIILSGENEAAAWIEEFSRIHEFEVFTEPNIGKLLSGMTFSSTDIIFEECFLNQKSKLKIRDKSSGIGLLPLIIGGVVAVALLGGGYYFFADSGGDKTLSESEKKKIISKLKKDELVLANEFMKKDGFSDAINYFSALSDYPKRAAGWTVSAIIFDVDSRVAMFTWKMTGNGNMEQIKSVRPGANIIVDQSKTSGDMAVENIQLKKSNDSHQNLSVESVTDKKSIDIVLTEVKQLHNVLLKAGVAADIQKKKPPSKSGIKFTGTYKSYDFTLAGKSYSQMMMVIQRLSAIKNIIPVKFSISTNGMVVKSWTINGKALIK